MEHTCVMRGRNRAANSAEDPQGFLARPDVHARECGAVDQLHDDESELAVALGVVDAADVVMADAARICDLGCAAIAIADPHDLDGHIVQGLEIARPVNVALAAPPENAQQTPPAEE